jgi:hypothetical protein
MTDTMSSMTTSRRVAIPGVLAKRGEESRLFACKAIGFYMEPAIPHDTLNIFRAGVDGSYAKRVVMVERSDMVGKAGSFSVGFYNVNFQSLCKWTDQKGILSFLSSQCAPIELAPGRHRIVAEWVQVYEPEDRRQTADGLYADTLTEHSKAAARDWLSMPIGRVAEIAGAYAAPPEVFAKHRDLVRSNAALAHLSMVNYQAFRGWVLQHRMGGPWEAANDWVARGERFSAWYTQVILPLLPDA